MKPVKGQKVEIVFRNSMIQSGIVESWTDQQSVLKDGTSFIIIENTSQDVMLIRIELFKEDPFLSTSSQTQKINEELDRVLDEEKKEYRPDLSLRAKNLVDLRLEQAKLEKEMISKKILRPDLGKVQTVNYELPSSLFTKNSGTMHNSRKKS